MFESLHPGWPVKDWLTFPNPIDVRSKELLDATSYYESYDMLPRVPNLLQLHILTLATSVFGECMAMLRYNIYNHLQSALKAKARAASPANQAGISSLHMPGVNLVDFLQW